MSNQRTARRFAVVPRNPFLHAGRFDRVPTAYGQAETMPMVGGVTFRCYDPPLVVDGVPVEAYGTYDASTGRLCDGTGSDREMLMVRIAGTEYAPPDIREKVDAEFSRLTALYAEALPWEADRQGLQAIERKWPDSLPRYEDPNDDPWLALSGTRHVVRYPTDHGTLVVGCGEGMLVKVACGRQRGVPAIEIDGRKVCVDVDVRFDAAGNPDIHDRFAHVPEMAGQNHWIEIPGDARAPRAPAAISAAVLRLAREAAADYAANRLASMKEVALEGIDRAVATLSHEVRAIAKARHRHAAPDLAGYYAHHMAERQAKLGELLVQRLEIEAAPHAVSPREIPGLD